MLLVAQLLSAEEAAVASALPDLRTLFRRWGTRYELLWVAMSADAAAR